MENSQVYIFELPGWMNLDQEKAIETVREFAKNQDKLDESKREEPPPNLDIVWQILKFITDAVNMSEEQGISLFYDRKSTSLHFYFESQADGVKPTEEQVKNFYRQLSNLWQHYQGIIKTINATLKNRLPIPI